MNKNVEIKQKFADESNIDIDLLNGNSFDSGDFSFRRDPYDFRIGGKVNFSKGIFPAITHVYIRSPARFSNSLLQLVNAYNFAVSNKIKTLVLPHFWYLPLGLTRLGSIDMVNLDKGEVFMPGPYELAIDGNYFY